jgi:hypothetical protein
VPVLLAWTHVDGSDCYIRGKCRNISPIGLQESADVSVDPGTLEAVLERSSGRQRLR